MIYKRSLKIIFFLTISLLLILGILIAFVLTFDWNLARPYINRQVSEITGRQFVIRGNLTVRFIQGLETEPGWHRYLPRPQISADDVQMSNPVWDTADPHMASAQRIVIALHLLPLLDKKVVITDLALSAPVIALQRRADGSNSWTMRNNGPSAWHVDIQRMTFADGNLHYIDEGIALDLRAKIASLASDRKSPVNVNATQSIQKFGLQFELGGSYRNAPVTGSGKAGAVLSLESENTVYPVQVDAQLGKNKFGIDGTLTDPRSLSGIDLQLTLGGASLADLYPLTGVLLPETPAYTTRGRLVGKKDDAAWDWVYRNFTGKIGESDVAGTVEYWQHQPRPLLRGTVTSEQLRLEDLGPTIGADSNEKKKARDHAPVQPDDKALPVEQFNTDKWGAVDADVRFTGKKLIRTHDIPLDNIVADIHMKDKVLSLTPLNFGMAGGDVTSNISLDGRKKIIDAQIKTAARHLKIRQLFPKLNSMQMSFGEVNGDAALTGHGNSVSAMLGTSDGELAATVSEGSVSEFVLEAAGLNVINVVFVKVFGDKQIHMNCAVSDFAVTNGRADVRRFVLDTDDAVIDISGDIDMAGELLNLDIRPQSKGVRIFSLRTPLYAHGTFQHPDVGPYKGPLALKAAAAIALASASPVAAVLPLVKLGKVQDIDCASELAKAMEVRAAPKSKATAAPAKPVTEAQVQKTRQEK